MDDSMATAWDQRADVIATGNQVQQLGHPSDYVVPRAVGADPADVTSFHPGLAFSDTVAYQYIDTSKGKLPGLSRIFQILAVKNGGELGGRISVPRSTLGAGKRRGQRAPGIRHGGGNHQARFRNKAVQKRKVASGESELSRAPKIARSGSSEFGSSSKLPSEYHQATSDCSSRQMIGDHPALMFGTCDSTGPQTAGDYAKTTSPPRLSGSLHIEFTENTTRFLVGSYTDPWTVNHSPQLRLGTFTTPAGAPAPLVDGANSGNIIVRPETLSDQELDFIDDVKKSDTLPSNTIVLPEPSLSHEEEFDFNYYLNNQDTFSEGDTLATLNEWDRIGNHTHTRRSLQHGSLMTLENSVSEIASSPGNGSNSNHLPSWYNEEYEDLDPFANQEEDPNALKQNCTDPTLSSLFDWELSDFEV
ncbi:MAG: hypothetical protein Q9207_002551 [Kuettlingeria erythrocarpa]